jgi:hypothetical protein
MASKVSAWIRWKEKCGMSPSDLGEYKILTRSQVGLYRAGKYIRDDTNMSTTRGGETSKHGANEAGLGGWKKDVRLHSQGIWIRWRCMLSINTCVESKAKHISGRNAA